MAFRDAQTLDFSAQDIFVLTGPTGSGKSSILDAMSFALYGETPRMGSRDLKKLIYQDVENPAPKARVVFAFRHLKQDYRITRELTSQSHRVELDTRENPEGEWFPLVNGSVSEIKKKIPQLLGLNFDAFRRVLVLPQGGFDYFLKQDSASERRALLMNLAQLGIYDKIQQAADGHRRESATRLEHIKGELRGIGAVSLQDLQDLQTQYDNVEAQSRIDQETFQSQDTQLKAAEQLWEALSEAAELHEAQEAHRKADSDIAQLEQQLHRGEQLVNLRTPLNYLEKNLQKAKNLEQIQQSLEQEQRILAQQEQALIAAQEELGALRAEVPAWEAAAEIHRQLLPTLARYEDLHRQKLQIQQQQSQQAQLRALAQTQYDQAIQAQHTHQETLQHLQGQADGLNVSTEQLESLTELGHQLKHLQTHLHPALEKAKAELKQWKVQKAEHEKEQQASESHYKIQQHKRREAQAALELVKTRLANLHQHVLAHELRGHLHIGQACPVCEQILHHPPALDPPPALPPLQAELHHAEQALKTAETEAQNGFQRLSQAQSRTQSHEAQESSLRERRSAAYNATRRLTLQLREELKVETLPSIESVRAAYQTLKKQALQKESLLQQLRLAEQAKQEQALQAARAQSTLQEKNLTLEQLQAQWAQWETQFQKVVTPLAEVLGEPEEETPDYATLCKSRLSHYQERLQHYAHQHDNLRSRESSWQKQHSVSEVRRSENQYQQDSLQGEIAQLRSDLESEQKRLGYPSLTALRKEMPDPQQLQDWKLKIQEHGAQGIALEQSLQRLKLRIAGESITQSVLEQQRILHQQLQTEMAQRRTEAALLRERIQQGHQQQQRSEVLQQELDILSAQHLLYERIYRDLSSRHLPDFLAKRILERVMAEGSQELVQLSNGRYCFELDENEELVVLDAWNAQEPRSVKTLSGGESFLASLALALALNQYLSQGIQLDSLFIDEGFGTLDAESLEMAASVVEKLQLSGKCVGIITHIPELAERFEARIEVIKSETGAKLRSF